MNLALRFFALIVGVIGFIVGLIVNFAYSTIHFIRDLGGADIPDSHGIIGFLVLLVGLVGSLLAPTMAVPASILLVLAGIGMFFVIHWAALLVSPFFFLAAILAYMDRPGTRGERTTRTRMPPATGY